MPVLSPPKTISLSHSYNIGDPAEDVRAQKLVQRLLDTHIMSSCAEVFEAFDESLMFGNSEAPSTVATLKHNFKVRQLPPRDHASSIHQLYTTRRAPCDIFYFVPVLLGAD